MAEEIIEAEDLSVQPDPIEKLYKNASKKLQVGSIDNFRRLLEKDDTRAVVYNDLVAAFGDGVKTKIGKDVNAFATQYGGLKKNTGFPTFASRFVKWLKNIWEAIIHFPSEV